MRAAAYGRLLFGASAVFFGIIALLWHDADTWQSLAAIWRMPLGIVVGDVLMAAQIAAGIAIAAARTTRFGAIALCIVYVLFCLACIPGIVRAPAVFGEYDGFFEQFALLCGAVALYGCTAATVPSQGPARTARIGLGLCAGSFTLAQAIYFRVTADLVPKWIPPNQTCWAVLTTIAFALAALAMLSGLRAQLAIRLMALMMALFAVLVWIPILIAAPRTHGNWSEFALTFLITGASLMVAAAQNDDGARVEALGAAGRFESPA